MQEGALVDVGACAHLWGGVDMQPTCRAHNSKHDTRTDHVLVGACLVPNVRAFATGQFGIFDVHAPIEIKINADAPKPQRALLLPPAITDGLDTVRVEDMLEVYFDANYLQLQRLWADRD
eukprot:11250449-Alexandrium_andersonii.AAC.1